MKNLGRRTQLGARVVDLICVRRASSSSASLDYPPGLRGLTPPPSLRVEGDLPTGPGVAIVGAREATEPALEFAHGLAAQLARAGVAVWSGGALGIDRAAHEGALDAGGVTVAVLGGGLDHPSPQENAPCFQRIRSGGGAIVSQFEDAVQPRPQLFLARNAVLAAATAALVIVECDLKSGARNAAHHARLLGRPRFVVLQAPWMTAGRGCYEELRLGAEPLLDARALIALALPGAQLDLFASAAAPPELAPLEARVLAAIEQGASGADLICERVRAAAAEVQTALFELSMRGLVVESQQGYRRAGR